ncbi:DNA-directed RNA polymerases I, II, and III subunit RPABC3-like isoform X4 [Cloeon dipterum]
MAGILFEDIFSVKDIDPGGKKFDKVSRFFCEGESFKMSLILDLNTMIYPVELNEKLRLVLASTLSEEGATDPGDYYSYVKNTGPSRADYFEYVAFGKFYRILNESKSMADDDKDEMSSRLLSVYASFGGLLMRLQGDASNFQALEVDQAVYLLIKKISF